VRVGTGGPRQGLQQPPDPADLHRLSHGQEQSRAHGVAHIAAYCERLDWSRVVVVGYVTGGGVRGAGQLELIGNAWPRAAELAISGARIAAEAEHAVLGVQPQQVVPDVPALTGP
jgi:hypothetical protein